MSRFVLVALAVLSMTAGCAQPLSTKSPLYWHEGEHDARLPKDMQQAVGNKAPASGGKALEGGPLAGKPGAVTYQVALPRDVPDAKLLIRHSRFHYAPMDPSKVDLLLTSGDTQIKRPLVFGDTGGWGTVGKSQWGMLAVDVGSLAAGTGPWQLTLSAAVERRGDVNIDGFFIVPGSVDITAEELAAADRIDIDGARYVGLSLDATTIRQDTFEGFNLVARAFVPHSLDVKVTLLDSGGKKLAVLYQAAAVPLADEATRIKVPGTRLNELADGSYTIRTEWQSAPTLDLAVELIGGLASRFDERLKVIAAKREELEKRHMASSPHVNYQRDALLVADFEHAVEYLSANWEKVKAGSGGASLIANVRRTLLQYEETVARLAKGADPYAGRTGDMRRAFRSATTGKLEPYRLIIPDAYRADGSTPCVMALNGTEDRFIDPRDGREVRVKAVANRRGYAILSPRASGGYWGESQQDLVQVLKIVLDNYPGLDRRRVYCTGPSAGGFGTYALATSHPDLFAAIACVSGVGNWDRFARGNRTLRQEFTTLPTLIIHGGADTLVSVDVARQVAEQLKKRGLPHELHVFPSHGHSYAQYAEQYMTLSLDYFDRYSKEATK